MITVDVGSLEDVCGRKKKGNHALPTPLCPPLVLYKDKFVQIWFGPREKGEFCFKKHLQIDYGSVAHAHQG